MISTSCMRKVILISDSCMQSPTDSSCTGEDIGGSDSLPDKVDIVYFNRNTISIFTPICSLPVPSKGRAAKKPQKLLVLQILRMERKAISILKYLLCLGDMLLEQTAFSTQRMHFQFLYTVHCSTLYRPGGHQLCG